MSALAMPRSPALDRLAFARRILTEEAAALNTIADRLGAGFEAVLNILANCTGRVAVTGVGKSADVGQKIVGTFNSTGTRAYSLDATRALHGDLGTIAPEDVAMLLSNSGESEEILRLLPPLRQFASKIVAITGNANSTLARFADASIVYGPIVEACPNFLAPSTSTTATIALGDAIAFTLSEERKFSPDDFAKFHPAGSLGRKLAGVEAHMRSGDELRIASANDPVRAVFAKVRHEGRRTGAIMLVDTEGKLAGLFTDSDLARLFERNDDTAFNQPIADVMIRTPVTIRPTAKVVEAIEMMRSRKISELPVVDAEHRPIGMIDITDVIGLEPPTMGSANRPALRLANERTE